MKLNFILLATFALLGLTACNSDNTKATAQQNQTEPIKEISIKKDKKPILVELFTSEG